MDYTTDNCALFSITKMSLYINFITKASTDEKDRVWLFQNIRCARIQTLGWADN